MPTYRVEVLARDGSTHNPITIEAANAEAAKAIASERGWIVGNAELIMPEMADRPSVEPPEEDDKTEAESIGIMGMVPLLAGLTVVIGGIWMAAAWDMDTTVGSSHNIGKIADREAAMGVGRTILTCGVIAFFGSKIVIAIRRG